MRPAEEIILQAVGSTSKFKNND